MANETRLEASNYSIPLTAYSVGYKETSKLAALLDFIAPPVAVGRRFEFKRSDNAQAFYSENDDIRSINAEFKKVQYTGESVNEKTLNKGLSIRLDKDEIQGDDWAQRYTAILVQRLLRNELRRAIQALDAIAVSQESTWDSDKNPDEDLKAMLIDSSNASGIRPNRMLFGESAWDLRSNCLDSQSTSNAFNSGAMNPTQLAEKLMLDDCKVLNARYQLNNESKALISETNVYAFFAQELISKDEASNLKRFYTPTHDGQMFGVFLSEADKHYDLTVEHHSSIVACSTLGVRKLSLN